MDAINKFIRANFASYTDTELAEQLNKTNKTTRFNSNIVEHRRRRMGLKRPAKEVHIPPEQELKHDHSALLEKKEKRTVQQKYEHALTDLDKTRKMLAAALALKDHQKPFVIAPYTSGGKGEALAVALASDWHIEESVTAESVGGMNFYDLDESKRRAERFFKLVVYLVQLEQKNTTINHLVLACLGDFISGDIHEDTSRSALLEPTRAILRCQDYLISGIEFILRETKLRLTIVCHSGNHGRKGHEQLIANEAGSSLEYLMYHSMKLYFRGNSRVQFVIPEGYHSYVDAYGLTIRFHHGHAIRYGGGVGGITIPVNKAIAQWNKTKDARQAPFYEAIRDTISEWNLARAADIDCFGHFHQFFDGGNFIANGSLIGYNPYGVYIKGSYEPPKQTLFFVHSKYGHYDTRRIMFPKDEK